MRWAAPLVLALSSACAAPPPPPAPPPAPEARPQPRAARPAPAGPSAESRAAAEYYRAVERRRVAQGLLRRDGGGVDTRFGAADLARNFERIALFSEFDARGGRFVAGETRATLRRWTAPVRVEMHFGASVPEGTRAKDRRAVDALLARLSRATGHPVSRVARGGNYHVFVVSLDEQAALAPALRAARRGIAPGTVDAVLAQPRETFCANFAFPAPGRPGVFDGAIALIRSEHPDLMRLACYHEEIAQGLGLPNDSPAARPSIFNEDDEFATLTTHDELLLSILYDPALRPGMTPAQARPVVRRLAAARMGGPS